MSGVSNRERSVVEVAAKMEGERKKGEGKEDLSSLKIHSISIVEIIWKAGKAKQRQAKKRFWGSKGGRKGDVVAKGHLPISARSSPFLSHC